MKAKTKKILNIVFPIILSVIIFFAGFLVGNTILDKDTRALRDILDKYKRYYLYEEENVLDIITESIFDQYSKYYSKEEYDEIVKSAKGYKSGIGITIDKTINKITSVIYNSPCEYAGVESGGIIKEMYVNDNKVSNIYDNLTSIKNGDKVKLIVDYSGTLRDFTITKQEYIQTYVRYFDVTGEYGFRGSNSVVYEKISETTNIVDEKVGYIKYSSFSGKVSGIQGSVGQLKSVLNTFVTTNKEHLIFDLRGNGGGYMDILEEVAGMLLPASNGGQYKIAYAKDKFGKEEIFKSKKVTFENYNIKKLTILANSGSASASEVLIGAILDYSLSYNNCDVKVIISDENSSNTSTYGKGIMQTTYVNLDGSAVKLTTAKLYSPLTNKSIHGIGFSPEYDGRISVCGESEILSIAQQI